MSTPADRTPLDPVSQALGRLEGRFDEFEKRMDARFAAVDRRFDDFEHRVTLRFEQVDHRFDRLDDRMWWLVAIVLSGLLAQVGTLVAVLVRR